MSFLQLADYCRLDSWSENRTVVLDTDLEVTGRAYRHPSFSGVFEGQGHVISGLSLVDDGSVIGFFRYVKRGPMSATLSSRPRHAFRQPHHRGRPCRQQCRYTAQLPV